MRRVAHFQRAHGHRPQGSAQEPRQRRVDPQAGGKVVVFQRLEQRQGGGVDDRVLHGAHLHLREFRAENRPPVVQRGGRLPQRVHALVDEARALQRRVIEEPGQVAIPQHLRPGAHRHRLTRRAHAPGPVAPHSEGPQRMRHRQQTVAAPVVPRVEPELHQPRLDPPEKRHVLRERSRKLPHPGRGDGRGVDGELGRVGEGRQKVEGKR